MQVIYTIGHSTQNFDDFLRLLKINNINCIIDVRSVPFSRFANQYNKDNLKYSLRKAGIIYVYMGKELGARRENMSLYDNGKLNFDKVLNDEQLINGINRVIDGIKKGFCIALMCTEKEPIDCHRCILLGRILYDKGYDVQNILYDGNLKSQYDIENELVDKYFPDRMQISMFDTLNNIDYKEEAYSKQSNEIAYSLDEY